jgi:magnesium transporter
VSANILDRQGRPVLEVDRAAVESRLADGQFFWLDVHEPDEEDFRILRDVFGFHALAVEDSEHFGQRPKLEEYEDVAFLVLYGAAPEPDEDRLVEMHCFYSERFLVTVRRDEAPACEAVRERYARREPERVRPIVLLYRLLDALVDSLFRPLSDLDDRLDTLQDELLAGPTKAQLQEVFVLRRRLAHLRRVVSPQRDLLGQISSGAVELPGLDDEARRYFRDVHDHLIRLSEQVDMYRDLLTGTLDLYLSNSSERLGEVMKQLTVIATIFLPLSFVTGFFGQNFGWLVDNVGSLTAFLILGIGLQLLTVLLLVVYFKRRGWFS